MSSIDWSEPKITTKEWLNPEVNLDSIFHAIQYLGLAEMNVIQLEKTHATKRTIYGLIAVSDKPISIDDAHPFDVATAYASQCVPDSYRSTLSSTQRNNLLLLPSKIKNSALSVNLLNFLLVSSSTVGDLGNRCGQFLKPYFGDKLEQALVKADDLTASILPLAFAHNYTAKKFPEKKQQFVYYFVVYKSAGYERILYINDSGELIEFVSSYACVSSVRSALETMGCSKIYAIVEDDSKQLIERLSKLRKELNDYDVQIAEQWRDSQLGIDCVLTMTEQKTTLENFRNVEKELTKAKNEFIKLWFEEMETDEILIDPKYCEFYNIYRRALQDDKEMKLTIKLSGDQAFFLITELENEKDVGNDENDFEASENVEKNSTTKSPTSGKRKRQNLEIESDKTDDMNSNSGKKRKTILEKSKSEKNETKKDNTEQEKNAEIDESSKQEKTGFDWLLLPWETRKRLVNIIVHHSHPQTRTEFAKLSTLFMKLVKEEKPKIIVQQLEVTHLNTFRASFGNSDVTFNYESLNEFLSKHQIMSLQCHVSQFFGEDSELWKESEKNFKIACRFIRKLKLSISGLIPQLFFQFYDKLQHLKVLQLNNYSHAIFELSYFPPNILISNNSDFHYRFLEKLARRSHENPIKSIIIRKSFKLEDIQRFLQNAKFFDGAIISIGNTEDNKKLLLELFGSSKTDNVVRFEEFDHLKNVQMKAKLVKVSLKHCIDLLPSKTGPTGIFIPIWEY